MSDRGAEAAAAASDIHAAFATATISIVPASGAPTNDVPAIPVAPMGENMSIRQRGYDVLKSDVPDKPRKGAAVHVGAEVLRVIETDDLPAVGSWRIMVEK